jgi:hypothetical protein
MTGGDILAIALSAYAAFAVVRWIVLQLEKLERPRFPDTGNDDPHLIAALCPWPTEGECWDAGETIRRGGDRAGQRPSVTHTNKPVISHHDEKRPTA